MAQTDLYSSTEFRLWVELDLLDLILKINNPNVILALLQGVLPGTPTTIQLIGLVSAYILSGNIQNISNIPVPIDAISCTTNFGLSEIPNCAISLALGRRMDNPTIASTAHFLADYLRAYLKVKVWATAKTTSGRQDSWPVNPDGTPNKFLVFDGYTVGAGFRAVMGAAEYVLFVTHWLSDLNFSSALSRTASPGTPASLAYPALISTGVLNGDTFIALSGALGSPTVLGTDFWGTVLPVTPPIPPALPVPPLGGLKQYMIRISSTDRFNWAMFQTQPGVTCPTNPAVPYSNKEALSALARFEPFNAQPGGTDELQSLLDDNAIGFDELLAGDQRIALANAGYLYGVPLPLITANNSILGAYYQRIVAAIQEEQSLNLSSSTLWDRLVGTYCREYVMGVVPMVDRALVIPMTPGLRQPWRTITSEEYDEFDHSVITPRPIRAVSLLAAFGFSTGASVNPAAGTAFLGGGIVYDACRDGLILVRQGPRWLSTIIFPNPVAKNVLNGVQTSSSPQANNSDVSPSVMPDVTQSFMFQYARALYHQEVLRHRQLRITGKVRFDISPGSAVAVQASREPFADAIIAKKLGIPTGTPYLHGMVIRVSTSINAEAQKASTTLQIGFIRDDAENADDTTSTDSHPIWRINWLGAPMVSDPAFS